MKKLIALGLSGLLLSAPFANAQPNPTSEAMKLALADDRLSSSEQLRVESAEIMQHRLREDPIWTFELTDGVKSYRVIVSDGEVESVREDDAGVSDRAAFWQSLPPASEFSGDAERLQTAKRDISAKISGATPRPEYFLIYDVCTPHAADAEATENGCATGAPKETWVAILRIDIEGKVNPEIRSVRYEDGEFSGIDGARVGGNW